MRWADDCGHRTRSIQNALSGYATMYLLGCDSPTQRTYGLYYGRTGLTGPMRDPLSSSSSCSAAGSRITWNPRWSRHHQTHCHASALPAVAAQQQEAPAGCTTSVQALIGMMPANHGLSRQRWTRYTDGWLTSASEELLVGGASFPCGEWTLPLTDRLSDTQPRRSQLGHTDE